MKKINFIYIFSLAIYCSITTTKTMAQVSDSLTLDTIKDKSQIRIAIQYTSDYLYMGRSDSVKAPYASPYIGYFHKSGLFISTSFSYLTIEKQHRIDLYKLSGGFIYLGKKTDACIKISSYFFNNSSYSVQSEMNLFLNSYVVYNLYGFMISADAGLGFSRNTDVFLGSEINRRIYVFKHKLRITPAMYVNAGTQQYYEEYYTVITTNSISGRGQRQGHSGQTVNGTASNIEILESTKFQVLDYEVDIQISYRNKKVQYSITPAWTFPVNPATFVSAQGTYKDQLKNRFYWSLGIQLII